MSDKVVTFTSWFGDNLVIRLTEAGRVAHELQKRNIPYKICVSMPEFLGMKQDNQTGLILKIN